jgi:uncharacterized protein YxeA
MKKIIALLLALMLVVVFTLGCKPAEKHQQNIQLLPSNQQLSSQQKSKQHQQSQLISFIYQGWGKTHP